MVIGRKEAGAAVLIVLAAGLVWKAFGPSGETPERAALRLDVGAEIPAIALDRLKQPATVEAEGQPSRDLFKFGREARVVEVAPVPTPVIVLQPTPIYIPTPEPSPTPTPWPLLNVSL